jgi:hypothetical protein
MHWFVLLLYYIYLLLHVSAVVCHHQEACWVRLSYLKYRSIRWHVIQCVVTWPVCRNSVWLRGLFAGIMCGYVACVQE